MSSTPPVRPWSARSFRAMGSACRIVAPDETLARDAERFVEQLERTWSRFLPDSEISAVNAAAGRLTIVSDLTYQLIAHAERARVATHGAFNPLMLDQLVALGYDRTWPEIDGCATDDGMPCHTVPGSDRAIELFPDVRGIRLPEGTSFDPGGIGKGLAGDLVAARLVEAGATSVQVELGGDVRLVGPSWTGEPWAVRVDDGDHGLPQAATITLDEGAVATSSTIRRRWLRGGVVHHHLLDPMSGRPAGTDLDAVTAVAPSLWWAEVVAKVALIAGSTHAAELMRRFGVTGLVVRAGTTDRYDVISSSRAAA